MRYVNDDWETGGINESCANPQPGRAEVSLPDDHPDLVEFHNPTRPVAKKPLSTEELYDMLETKGILSGPDRPKTRP